MSDIEHDAKDIATSEELLKLFASAKLGSLRCLTSEERRRILKVIVTLLGACLKVDVEVKI